MPTDPKMSAVKCITTRDMVEICDKNVREVSRQCRRDLARISFECLSFIGPIDVDDLIKIWAKKYSSDHRRAEEMGKRWLENAPKGLLGPIVDPVMSIPVSIAGVIDRFGLREKIAKSINLAHDPKSYKFGVAIDQSGGYYITVSHAVDKKSGIREMTQYVSLFKNGILSGTSFRFTPAQLKAIQEKAPKNVFE